MKRKTSKKLPKVSKAEVDALPKREAVLLRLTADDKQTVAKAASRLHLTMTEFLTRSALMVANKVGK
ncbi:MAG: DUF1778 domain-containing protein [Opitutus sp.]|nr:DUF1778 domain-containing protein [Opitutus sp.]